MNALDLLERDHRTVETLFRRFERASKGQQQREIVDEIVRELSIHAVIEEALVYPSIRERIKPAEDLTLEALEEHHVVKWLVKELENMPPDHERFEAKVSVLKEAVSHHVEEEENELFPKVRRGFKAEELELLGAALFDAKQTAPTRPHPRAPDEPPANLIAGGLSAILDRGRELLAAGLDMGKSAVKGAGDGLRAPLGNARSKKRTAPKRATGGKARRTATAAKRGGTRKASKGGRASSTKKK